MAGRITLYDDSIADEICEYIIKNISLATGCEENPHWPSHQTVYNWLNKYPEFFEKYTRAREIQQDREADHIIQIADTTSDPAKAKIQIDARKWRASKLAPKKYGDKQELTVTNTGDNAIGAASLSQLGALFQRMLEERAMKVVDALPDSAVTIESQ